MKLIEVIRDLNSLDDDGIIFAAEPRTENSETAVAHEPESGDLPAEAERLNLKYLLEVLVAREVLQGWMANLDVQPSPQQQCARLIRYAILDA